MACSALSADGDGGSEPSTVQVGAAAQTVCPDAGVWIFSPGRQDELEHLQEETKLKYLY